MKRLVLAAAALAAACNLAACGQLGGVAAIGDAVANADTAIEKAQADYDQAKAFLDMIGPFLPASRVAQIHSIEARVKAAIDLARKAKTVADQVAQLLAAQKATTELNGAVANPPGS